MGGEMHRQPQIHRPIDNVLISECDLVRGQRRLTPGAVRHDLVPLIQEPPSMNLRERPPHRLDVALVQGPVRVLQIQPEPDPLGQPVPLLKVREHRLAAIPYSSISDLWRMPSFSSTAISTGSPWQSQPPLRATNRPRIVW